MKRTKVTSLLKNKSETETWNSKHIMEEPREKEAPIDNNGRLIVRCPEYK